MHRSETMVSKYQAKAKSWEIQCGDLTFEMETLKNYIIDLKQMIKMLLDPQID